MRQLAVGAASDSIWLAKIWELCWIVGRWGCWVSSLQTNNSLCCSSVNNIEFHINIYRFRCNQQSSVGQRPSVDCGFQLNRFQMPNNFIIFTSSDSLWCISDVSTTNRPIKGSRGDVSAMALPGIGIFRDFSFSIENSIYLQNLFSFDVSAQREAFYFCVDFLLGQTLIHLREDDDKVRKGRENWTNNRKKGH